MHRCPLLVCPALGFLLPGCAGDPPASDRDTGVVSPTSACASLPGWTRGVEDGLEITARADATALAVETFLLGVRASTVRAASEATAADDRADAQAEAEALVAAMEQIALTTRWGETTLCDGSVTAWEIAVGDDPEDFLTIPLLDLRPAALGVDAVPGDLGDASFAEAALPVEEEAFAAIAAWRRDLADLRPLLVAAGATLEAESLACPVEVEFDDEAGASDSFDADPAAGEQAVVDALLANLAEGRALLLTAGEGAGIIDAALGRMRTLAAACANETLADDDRSRLALVFADELSTVDLAARTTSFHGIALLDGSVPRLSLLVDDCAGEACRFDLALPDLGPESLGVDPDALDVTSASAAQSTLDPIDQARAAVAGERAALDAQDEILAILAERAGSVGP